MDYLNQTDIDKRMQSAFCCAGSLTFKVDKEFRYGMKCANHNLEKLFELEMIIFALDCYEPLDPSDPDETINCITEEQAQYLFDRISIICKTCFESINHTYE